MRSSSPARPFDLLFTDVIMPGLNGRQLADEILKIKPGLKVLFTSGYTENAIIHHGRLDEGVLLLAKPYRKSDMAVMIRKALAAIERVLIESEPELGILVLTRAREPASTPDQVRGRLRCEDGLRVRPGARRPSSRSGRGRRRFSRRASS